MAKSGRVLVLAVDRDDDFGRKGGVQTPCVGVDACLEAAQKFGVKEPEDSDLNALYNAIHEYNDILASHDAEEVQVALICGDESVGRRSDRRVREQLEEVLSQFEADEIVVVTDGSEDKGVIEYIMGLVHIIDVKATVVKQTRNAETIIAIIAGYMKEPEKRKRFLAPLSWLIIFISMIYLAANLFTSDSVDKFFLGSTTLFIFLAMGVLIMLYAYSLDEKIRGGLHHFMDRVRAGSIIIVFVIAAVLLFLFGIILGVYSMDDIYTTRTTERVLVFIANGMWPALFGIMMYLFGVLVDGYMSRRSIRYLSIIGCLNVLAIGLIMTGALDYLIGYTGLFTTSYIIIMAEIFSGIIVAVAAGAISRRMKKTAEIELSEKQESANEVL